MITRIFLVRHGRTALNAQGRFRGRRDVPLDEQGLADAAEAARRLTAVALVAVYTSPLLRTRQTAEAVAAPSGAPVLVEPDLIDLDHGRWEGLTPEEAAAQDAAAFQRFRTDPCAAEAPGGERLADVEARILAALRRIGARHPGAACAAVSHEIPIRLAIAHLSDVRGPAVWELPVATGSVTELRFEDGALALASPGRGGTGR
jgi:broad specificity phosphatase PhoE